MLFRCLRRKHRLKGSTSAGGKYTLNPNPKPYAAIGVAMLRHVWGEADTEDASAEVATIFCHDSPSLGQCLPGAESCREA